MARARIRIAAAALAVLATAGATYVGYAQWAPRHTPAGQPGLRTVAQLDGVREDFNAAAAETRVLALLSPT